MNAIRPPVSDPAIVLGVTGPNASGKGEVCRFLSAHGFAVHSLSDVIRDEAARQGVPPEREHLIRLGNELRERGGSGVLARGILPKLDGPTVIDSIRNPEEVAVLRELPRFVLLGVHAPVELRFARSRERARPGDPQTLEAFVGREQQENSKDPAAQQLDATFALADETVENAGDLDRLYARIVEILADRNVIVDV